MTDTGHEVPTTEFVRHVIDSLVAERNRLRREEAGAALLDANLLALGYWKDELARLGAEARERSTG